MLDKTHKPKCHVCGKMIEPDSKEPWLAWWVHLCEKCEPPTKEQK